MDDKELVEAANTQLAVVGGSALQITDDSELYFTTEVFAEYDGHPVRIEFTKSDSNPPSYRYNATVYDAETGELITTGNGGTDWQDAFSIVQWRKLNHYWD